MLWILPKNAMTFLGILRGGAVVGYIDSTQYLITCPKCSAEDAPRAIQYGSMYSAGHWGGPSSEVFSLALELQGEERVIVSASCNRCGAEALVQITHTGP